MPRNVRRIWRNDVLAQLDEVARRGWYPARLTGDVEWRDMRRSVFCAGEEWLVGIQVLGRSRDGRGRNEVIAFGNRLDVAGEQATITVDPEWGGFLGDAELLAVCGRAASGMRRVYEQDGLDGWQQLDTSVNTPPSAFACVQELAETVARHAPPARRSAGEVNHPWYGELLCQLDEDAALSTYPGLSDVHVERAHMRCTAWWSDDEWLVTVEVLGWDTRVNDVTTVVHAYGNGVERGRYQGRKVVTGPGGTSLPDAVREAADDLRDVRVEVRGRLCHLRPTAEELRAARVHRGAMSPGARVVRFLSAQLRDEMFLTDEELLAACRREGAGLTRLLRLDGWRQPDPRRDEKPSDMACLRSLAAVIAAGDASRYTCPESWNTHWLHGTCA